MPCRDARETAEDVARRSYGKLIAYLAARTRDVAAAEDALSDAFAAALGDWPAHGIPDRPEAWLVAVARRIHLFTCTRNPSWSPAKRSAPRTKPGGSSPSEPLPSVPSRATRPPGKQIFSSGPASSSAARVPC